MTKRTRREWVGLTGHGTRIYHVQVGDPLLLRGMGRAHNPPSHGALATHLMRELGAPAVAVIKTDDNFVRVLKLTEDGLLFPVDLTIVPADAKKVLAQRGVISESRAGLGKPKRRGKWKAKKKTGS